MATWEDSLKDLVPSNHWEEDERFESFLKAMGMWLDQYPQPKIEGLRDLINPYNVDVEYLPNLSSLIGLKSKFYSQLTTPQKRNLIAQAVDFYKVRGTYNSFNILMVLYGFNVQIMDLYTNDYLAFTPEEWFCGDVGTVPANLTTDYYKSPHFGVEFILETANDVNQDVVTDEDGDGVTEDVKVNEDSEDKQVIVFQDTFLWYGEIDENIFDILEYVRPINTVPDYGILLPLSCSETGEVNVMSGYRYCAVQSNWTYAKKYFDDGHDFDDGVMRFDEYDTTQLDLVTVWKLGTGSRGIIPDPSTFPGLETITATGTIDSRVDYDEYVLFTIHIPASTELLGLSELGLYMNDSTTLVVAATFPIINKTTDTYFRIELRVYTT